MPSVAVPIVTGGGSDDVAVVRDRRRDFGSHIVKIRVLRVPPSDRFPDGVKYAFHYGVKYAFHYGRRGGDESVLRYDNHHGVHERHEGGAVEEIDFPGYERLLRRFVGELPDEHAPYGDLDP